MFKLLSKDLVKSSKIRDTFPEEKNYEIGFSDQYNKYLKFNLNTSSWLL